MQNRRLFCPKQTWTTSIEHVLLNIRLRKLEIDEEKKLKKIWDERKYWRRQRRIEKVKMEDEYFEKRREKQRKRESDEEEQLRKLTEKRKMSAFRLYGGCVKNGAEVVRLNLESSHRRPSSMDRSREKGKYDFGITIV